MIRIIIILICFGYLAKPLYAQIGNPLDDVGLNMTQIIEKYGYPVETHDVVTEDGYILTMHRIKHGKNSTVANKKPTFLMHGMSGAADCFTVGPSTNCSIAYILADNGYDVWLGNARGTIYCRKHLVFNDTTPNFFNYSWHEIAIYDVPAMIDYVLERTNSRKLGYVGHSQGTTVYLVLLSEKPEYNEKIALGGLLAPTSFENHMNFGLIRSASNLISVLETWSSNMNLNELIPGLNSIAREICQRNKAVCNVLLTRMCHYCQNAKNKDLLPVIYGLCINSVTTRQLAHYAQEIVSGHFRQFDFGTEGNMKQYGRATPPDYNLSNVKCPTALYYSEDDSLGSSADVIRLAEELPNVVSMTKMPKKFDHLDFIFTRESVDLVVIPFLELLKRYL